MSTVTRRSRIILASFPRIGFIVTTLTGTNQAVVRFYDQRGTAEPWIKEGETVTLLLPVVLQGQTFMRRTHSL